VATPNVGTSCNCLVGAVIQHHRKQRPATQQHLAKALGLTQSAYSRLERGVTAFSVPQFKQVAQALRLSATELLNTALRTQDELCANTFP
jgi:transcriptional regulator with XRE-family HTH domain